jgi:hypothetical protein
MMQVLKNRFVLAPALIKAPWLALHLRGIGITSSSGVVRRNTLGHGAVKSALRPVARVADCELAGGRELLFGTSRMPR